MGLFSRGSLSLWRDRGGDHVLQISPLFASMRVTMGLCILLSVLMAIQVQIFPLVVFAVVGAGCWWVQDRVAVTLTPDSLQVRNVFSSHTFDLDDRLTVSLHKRRLVVQVDGEPAVTATAVDLNHDFKNIPSRGKDRVLTFLDLLGDSGVEVETG